MEQQGQVRPSPKLCMEAWQCYLIFGSDELKRRVAESLLKLLIMEDRLDEAQGLEQKDRQVGEAGGGEEEGEEEGGKGEQESEAAKSARLSATWQKALDQVVTHTHTHTHTRCCRHGCRCLGDDFVLSCS